jgi:hypothetical protein
MRAEAPRQPARNSLVCSVQGACFHSEDPCRSVLRRSRLVRGYRTSVNPSGVAHADGGKSAAVAVQLLVERRVQLPLFRVTDRKPPLLWTGPLARRWLARASCSIKYAFTNSCSWPRPRGRPQIRLRKRESGFLNLSLIETPIAVCECHFRSLNLNLLEEAAFAADLHRSSLMKNIYPVGMYLSARYYGDCGEHDERR